MTTTSTLDVRQLYDAAYTRGVALVVLAGCIWSTTGVVIRLMDSAGPWEILYYRGFAAVPTLLLIIAVRRHGAVISAFRESGALGFLAGVFGMCASIFYIFALQFTTVADTLFLLSAAPFITAIIARIALAERVMAITWLTMAMAMAGITVMISGDSMDGFGISVGHLLAFGAAFFYSYFTVTLRAGRGRDMIPGACLTLAMTSACAFVVMWIQGAEFAISGRDLLLCSFLGTVQLGIGLLVFLLGARTVPAAELNLLALVEVVLGPVWVWLVISEAPAATTLIGGFIVLCAVGIRALFTMRRRVVPGIT